MPDNEKPSKIPSPSDLFKTNINTPSPDEVFSSKKTNAISEGFAPVEYNEGGGSDNIESTLDFIQKNSKRVMRDDEKDILRDMINNPNTKKEDLSDAIVTLQGKKAKQQENTLTTPDYYMDRNKQGVYKPVALAYGEKAPVGKDVAKVWGTQKSANDDNWYTDLAKTAYNIIPSSVENVVDLAQAATTLVTGEESKTLQATKNSANALKMAKDEDLSASIYNTEGINEWGDLISKDRLNFTPEAIWGTVNGALGSVGEMLTLGGLANKGLGLGAKAATFTGSYLTNLGEAMDSAEEAGLTGRDKSAFALAVTVPLAAIDAKFDIGGKILANQIANRTKNDIIKGVGQRIVKDEFGNITEESLKQASKEAISAYAPLVSSFAKTATKDVLQEGGEEALQSFVSTAGEQLWDKLTPEDKTKFGTDAFSAESFGKYISEGVAGLVGGAPMSISSAKGKQKAEHQEQSNSAYEAVKDGQESVKALKTNLNNSFERGEISKPDLENALFKVDAYDEYHNTTKDLSLDDTNRKTLFELSLQKENLKHSIKEVESKDTKGHSRLDELNPAQLGLHNAKVKQAKALQEEIDLIVAKSEIIQQPVVSEKIVDKVIKEEEKANETPKAKEAGEPKSEFGEMMGRYNIKVPEKGAEISVGEGTEQEVAPVKKVQSEKRLAVPKFDKKDEGGNYVFNSLNDPLKQKQALHDYFDENPQLNNEVEGTIEGGQNNVWKLNIGGSGRYIQFARSIDPTNLKGAIRNFPNEKTIIGDEGTGEHIVYRQPVGMRLETIKSDTVEGGRKRVLNIYNKTTGKHIAFGKELKKGNSNPSPLEIKQFEEIIARDNKTAYKPKDVSVTDKVNKVEPVTTTKEKPTEKPIEQEKREPVTITPEKAEEVAIGEGTKQVVQKPKDTSREVMNEVYSNTPKTFEDAVLIYFAGGGKMSIKSYVEGTGFGEKHDNGRLKDKGRDEYNANKWVLREEGMSLTDLAKKIWNENAGLQEGAYVESEAIEVVKDALNEYPSQQDMVGELTSRYKKEVKLETAYASDEEMRYAEEQEQKEKDANERVLSEAEVQDLVTEEKYRKESDEYQADKYETFQKESAYKEKEETLNDKYLDKIQKQAKNIKDGKEIYERYSQTEIPGFAESGIRGIEAAIISGRNVKGDENQDDRVERQEKDLETYAKRLGIWEENTEDYLLEKYGEPMDSGQESLVFRKNGKRLIKTSITNQYLDLQDFFDGIVVHNAYFPESAVEVVGFGKDSEGEFNVITEQNYINGTHDISQEQINEYMESIGFKNVNSRGRFKNNDVLINDVVPRNVMVMPKGEIIPFDTIAHLNTKSQPMNESGTRGNIHSDYTNIDKVIDVIKKAFPKVEIVIDDTMSAAGKLGKDGKIYINPNYARLDTPIHEAGHILIDLMGDNKVIKAAIEQLKNSPLWAETKERYKELSEGQLGKEVLAEAIGREGADIFDTQVEKNKFSKYLDYIFDWFKTKLGINKNIAKSLAKQIIGGIGTKNAKEVKSDADQLQKPKEEGDKKPKKPQVMGFNLYRETYHLRNTTQETKDLDYIDNLLANPNITPTQARDLNLVKDKIKKLRSIDSTKYAIYKSDLAQINEIKNSTDLDAFSLEELTKALNSVESLDKDAKASFGNDVKTRIGYYLHRKGQERISKEHKDYVESVADKKDINKLSVKMMVLSHADQNQPAMQELSKSFDNSYLDMVLEVNDKQNENTQLARAVIKEKNSKMGISDKVANLFSSDNSKYFEYMDNGKGELLTKEEAAKKNLSKAQTSYLNFMRDLITERSKQLVGGEYVGEDMDMEVIKVDKSFMEAFKSEGLVEAFSYYLGGGRSNLRNVRIEYKDPITGVTKNEYFGTIEQRLAQLGKKGALEKSKALGMLLHYNFKAKRQLKTGQNVDEKQFPLDVKGDSEYSLNGKGQLVSKFDKNRGEGRGYSKDFYRAANEFIAETAHTKHLSPIVAIAQSVQHLAKNGYIQEGILEKPKVAEYLEEWMNMHLFKQANSNDPLLDATLRKLRGLTSMSTMLFNITAQGINAFMGNYNNYRSENAKTVALGNKRMFGGKHEITKRGGYGAFNPYAMDIIKMYNVANVDTDSNPRLEVGSIFEKIGSLGTRWGEIQIQSSLALGLMSEEDYNSFHYVTNANGVKKLEVKPGIDKQGLKERIISHTNRVSDIQGKYGEKDRRNILNGEFGKAVFQFKVWIPDWWKERYGSEYIDRNNVVRKGSWNIVTSKGRKDLLKLIDKKGWKKGLFDGKTPESKAFLSSLKGVMITGMFLVLKYSDDEDDRKRKQAMLADKMIGNMLFVFDPNSLSFTIKTPAACLGTATKMVDAVGKLMKFDSKEAKSAGKDAVNVLPGKKLYKYIDEVTDEE